LLFSTNYGLVDLNISITTLKSSKQNLRCLDRFLYIYYVIAHQAVVHQAHQAMAHQAVAHQVVVHQVVVHQIARLGVLSEALVVYHFYILFINVSLKKMVNNG
jgi:hypothetical protein